MEGDIYSKKFFKSKNVSNLELDISTETEGTPRPDNPQYLVSIPITDRETKQLGFR